MSQTHTSKLGVTREFLAVYRTNEQFRVRDFGAREVNHRDWNDQNNPQGWTDDQWQRFTALMNANGAYAQRVRELRAERHKWAAKRVDELIQGKKISHAMRTQMRREINREAYAQIPNPCPLSCSIHG